MSEFTVCLWHHRWSAIALSVSILCVSVQEFVCLCVFKCAGVCIFTHQCFRWVGQGGVILHLVLGPTHHEGFYWSCPWSGSGDTPFRSIPSPRTPCCFCAPSSSQQPLTSPCQGLFPKIRLNMNIHKQNGTPRLWKLSKTYLHLILKEPPPTPYRELATPFGPPKRSY